MLHDFKTLADVERDHILYAIKSIGNMTETARALGVARSTLYRLMRFHGITFRKRRRIFWDNVVELNGKEL